MVVSVGSVCHRVTAPKAVPTGLDLRHEFVVGLQRGELCVSCFKLSRLYKKKTVLEGALLIALSWCFLIRHFKYFTTKPFYLLESVFPFASLLLISTLLQKPVCTSAEVPCCFVLLLVLFPLWCLLALWGQSFCPLFGAVSREAEQLAAVPYGPGSATKNETSPYRAL